MPQSVVSASTVSSDPLQEVLDQSQPLASYGFWFEDDMIRWQEFMPRLPDLVAIELYVSKYGDPGNMIVEVKETDGTLLAQRTIAQANVVSNDWNRIEFTTPVSLTPGTKYRIYVYSDADSPNTENRYVWRGSGDSTYDSSCQNDVSDAHPTYDYAFKTYVLAYVTYLPLVSRN